MIQEKYIEDFIKRIDNQRTEINIEGMPDKFNTWLAWYKGSTSFHKLKIPKGANGYKRTQMLSSGIAKIIAEEWASNYANENTTITINKDDKQNDLVQEYLKANKVMANFGKFVEKFSALSVGATIVMPDSTETDENGYVEKSDSNVKISFIDATRIMPITVYDGKCTECAFVRYGTKTCTLIVHILVNGKYVIGEANAKKGTSDNWDFDYANAKVLETDTKTPLFQLWTFNLADNKDLDNSIGCSIYANAIDTFKQIDIIFDAYFREFKNSAKKRFISTDLMQYDEKGGLTEFIVDEEEYVIPKDVDNKNLIQEFNGDIRVQSLMTGLEFMLNYAGKQCGLGTTKFTFSNGARPLQTATAVLAKESEMGRNIIKQENNATDCFIEMLMAIKYVNNNFTNNIELSYEEKDIEVVYDDNIIEDTQSKRERDLKEVQAGIMTQAEYRAEWYDEDEDSASEVVYENGLLLDKYLPALQSGAVSPEQFIKLVYGDNPPKGELEYIKSKMNPQAPEMNDENYTDEMMQSE